MAAAGAQNKGMSSRPPMFNNKQASMMDKKNVRVPLPKAEGQQIGEGVKLLSKNSFEHLRKPET